MGVSSTAKHTVKSTAKRKHNRQRIRPDGIPGWAYVAAGGCLALAFGYVAFVPIVLDGDGENLSAGAFADNCANVPLICPTSPPFGAAPPPLALPSDLPTDPTTSPGGLEPPTAPATTEAPTPVRPVPKPAPLVQVLLSDLAFTREDNGRGPVERNRSNGEEPGGDGRTLTIGGVQFATGLGVHAPSDVQVRLDGGCTRFTAMVGVDDEKDRLDEDGRVIFRVLADGQVVFQTPELSFSDQPFRLEANVPGARFVDLVVDSAGSPRSDHADWADAKFFCSAG